MNWYEAYGIKNPYYADDVVCIIHGKCEDILPSIQGISAVVTDPPYGLEFMNKEWDGTGISFQATTWRLIREACLPGAMLLSFGGTRTSHRIACAIEDAGWQIRDTIMYVFGSGFPKSLDISKAIDKHGGKEVGWFGKWLKSWRAENNITQKEIALLFPSKTGGLTGCVANWELGFNMPTPEQFNLICKTFNLPFTSIEEAEREVVGQDKNWGKRGTVPVSGYGEFDITAPATPEAKLWEGYGTALKPSYEPILVCMKPLDGTFAQNALKHKVAGLNIDRCRIPLTSECNLDAIQNQHADNPIRFGGAKPGDSIQMYKSSGRFPANFILGYPEDEYELREGITTIERENVVKWLYENT